MQTTWLALSAADQERERNRIPLIYMNLVVQCRGAYYHLPRSATAHSISSSVQYEEIKPDTQQQFHSRVHKAEQGPDLSSTEEHSPKCLG